MFCDGYYDCPNGEDEERVSCMYYKLVSAHPSAPPGARSARSQQPTNPPHLTRNYTHQFVSHLDILTNTFLTWVKRQDGPNVRRYELPGGEFA